MICLVIAGAKGTGKTTYIKDMLKKVNKEALYIYDVNREYGEFYNKPFVDVDEFIEMVKNVREAVIVFEEASFFFHNKSFNRETVKILQRSRHTKNLCIFVFHSLRNVPRYIIDLINYYIIFKTNDTNKLIENKFDDPELLAVFERIKNSNDRHYNEKYTVNTLPGAT